MLACPVLTWDVQVSQCMIGELKLLVFLCARVCDKRGTTEGWRQGDYL